MQDAFQEWFASLPLRAGSRAWTSQQAVAAVVNRDDDSGDGLVIRAVVRDDEPVLEIVHHSAPKFEEARDEIDELFHR